MKCSHCSEGNSEGARFCKSCGLELVSKPSLYQTSPQSKKSFFSGLGNTTIGIISLIVIYLVINGVLWLGQEAYHSEDNAQLSQMETRMKTLDSQITLFENRMNRTGVTEAEYAGYQKMVDDYNKTTEEYNALAEKSGTRWYLIPVPGGHTKSTSHSSQ